MLIVTIAKLENSFDQPDAKIRVGETTVVRKASSNSAGHRFADMIEDMR